MLLVSVFCASSLLLACAFGLTASSSSSYKKNPLILENLPDTGEPWLSLSNGVEVQPATNLSPLAQEHFRRLTNAEWEGNPYEKMFVDGAETCYDEYAQAWRALGFYIDCDYESQEEEAEDDEGAQSGCRRFLLWAAYVDEQYSGNGPGEYIYYDRKRGQWTDEVCAYENSTRCVKMDCHLKNTHFSLLGFFKEPNYDEWMEQLFKHEGDCVWTDDEYKFMQQHREMWPLGCTKTNQNVTLSGKRGQKVSGPLYYDLKPAKYGNMEFGLYTDSNGVEQYAGDITMEAVARGLVCSRGQDGDDGDDTSALCATGKTNYTEALKATGGSSGDGRNIWSLVSSVDTWNDGFDVWKQCQPCKTYDLTNVMAGMYYVPNANGDRYSSNTGDDDYYGGGQRSLAYRYYRGYYYYYDDTFYCHDDAGYSNVNQCMKFKTKTKMMTAKFTDIEAAATQGTIVHIHSANFGLSEAASTRSSDEKELALSYCILIVSAILFGLSFLRWYLVSRGVNIDENQSRGTPPVLLTTPFVAA